MKHIKKTTRKQMQDNKASKQINKKGCSVKKTNGYSKTTRKTNQQKEEIQEQHQEEQYTDDSPKYIPVVESQNTVKDPQERYYCTNPNLLREMYLWRNSLKDGIRVKKLVGKRKMVDTKILPDTLQQHEAYEEGMKYFIEYPKTHRRYVEKLYLEKIPKKERDAYKFYREYKDRVIEDVTQYVIDDGYAFDIDVPQEREFTDNFAKMVLMTVKKISNHSFFRRYSQETKEDCQLYAIEKIFKGLFNYKLRYTNVFAYLTQAVFNSFRSELSKYYKQINIKRSLTKRAMIDLHSSMAGSSMEKCLGNQFKNNDYDDFSEF